MPNAPQNPSSPLHRRGLLVVIALGVIFFALLTLLVLFAGKHRGEPPVQAESLSVLPMRLRIRTEPNAKAPVVTTASEGDILTVLEDRGSWVQVKDKEGLTGWAERNSLERTAERERRQARSAAIRKLPALDATITARTPLYAGPGIFYPLVGELTPRKNVKVFTRDHDFYAIDNNGAIAYVDIDAVDVSAAGTRQVDVGTTATAPATETTASMTPPPATDTTLPLTASTPVQQPDVVAGEHGVYSVVPPGGTQPEEIDRVVPRYPAQARMREIAGPVVIRGIVRKDGTIDDVEIIKDLPYGLGEAAREAVERWRFRPASYRGEPIDVYYTVTVNFRLR